MSNRPTIRDCVLIVAVALVCAGCHEASTPMTAGSAADQDGSATASDRGADAPSAAAVDQPPVETVSSGAATAVGAQAASSTSAAAAPQVPSAAPQAPASKPGVPQNITFDTLKFPLEKNEDFARGKLTATIEELNGRPVKLRGYILPSFQQSGLTQFVLVRDNMECCFGPGAALYDCVVVDMKPGKTTDYTVRPVAVEGTFELRDFKGPDGKFLAIYHLDGEAVRF